MQNKNFKKGHILGQIFLLKAEEIGYYIIAIGLLLGFLLVAFEGFKTFLYIFTYKDLTKCAIDILNQFLIALIFLEIFYTVQVALLEESAVKCIEPFLLVAITALVRRLLILSFEISHLHNISLERIKYFHIELLELGVLILALVGGLVILRKTKRI